MVPSHFAGGPTAPLKGQLLVLAPLAETSAPGNGNLPLLVEGDLLLVGPVSSFPWCSHSWQVHSL